MKTLLLITLLYVIPMQIQAAHCDQPLSVRQFEPIFHDIRASPNDRIKYNKALNYDKQYCLSSNQVMRVAQLFSTDYFRLEFASIAYHEVFDPTNFYDVYDAFGSFSMAFRLHDMIHGLIAIPPVEPPEEPVVITFPDLNYPESTDYNGKIGCTNPVNYQHFENLAYRVIEFDNDDQKLNSLAGRSQTDCFTMAQAMKFATLLETEIGQLGLLKAIFPNLFDLEHFQYASTLFGNPNYRNEWEGFASHYLTPIPPDDVITCEPTNGEMETIITSFKNKNFTDEKLELAKILVNDYCFSVGQIRRIMADRGFTFKKLELAKITYYNCVDKHNYYQLLDELTFSREKEELSRFIRADGG